MAKDPLTGGIRDAMIANRALNGPQQTGSQSRFLQYVAEEYARSLEDDLDTLGQKNLALLRENKRLRSLSEELRARLDGIHQGSLDLVEGGHGMMLEWGAQRQLGALRDSLVKGRDLSEIPLSERRAINIRLIALAEWHLRMQLIIRKSADAIDRRNGSVQRLTESRDNDLIPNHTGPIESLSHHLKKVMTEEMTADAKKAWVQRRIAFLREKVRFPDGEARPNPRNFPSVLEQESDEICHETCARHNQTQRVLMEDGGARFRLDQDLLP
ncbi:hypothetical protein [Thioalkalivibrio thiocyanodenitrificans]|uniref:hypothetical protein n=1 Tax=Thioalkalivibrio thiocyanodenitrificans TaxID=243063 RepID=UPI00035ECC0E|nr:hypothetical protein [Thioalkalivibrio thiocyanodenitrificans]